MVQKSISDSELLSQHFVGFVLFDGESKEYLQQINADRYFTPASNTKLFTLYAGLKILGDSIPGMKYVIRNDSLIFWGTGDPTLLHDRFEEQPVFDFLRESEQKLFYALGYFMDAPYGAGWAWDDYPYYFQPEISGMPIYGNTATIFRDSLSTEIKINPDFFKNYFDVAENSKGITWTGRNPEQNIFHVSNGSGSSDFKKQIPFKTSEELFVKLLSDTLNREIKSIAYQGFENPNILNSRPVEPVFSLMLKASDNFLAEQILQMCASEFADSLYSSSVRSHIKARYLKDLTSDPIWKDGSGLSRYNLFTPRSMVQLLEKIRMEMSDEQLLALLPAGGVEGTLRRWYKSEDGEPFVFAKTGTLSNNHSLSGFIKTKSGKLLTFSFMNNNYNSGSSPVKVEMDKILRLIRDRY